MNESNEGTTPLTAPRPDLDRKLMRLVSGECTPEERRVLERRISSEPAVESRYQDMKIAWDGLDLAPSSSAPPELQERVLGRLRREGRLEAGAFSGSAAPSWFRTAAAAALLAGIVLGGTLGFSSEAELREADMVDRYCEMLGGVEELVPHGDAFEPLGPAEDVW